MALARGVLYPGAHKKQSGREYMVHRHLLALLAATTMLSASTAIAKGQDDALQMVSIDVEGGGGTLFVTPDGHSLLIDTGNPEESRVTGDHPSSERIVAVAHQLGIKKIDYVITTHYHSDHVGGLPGLLKRIDVGTFIDHGPNRELAGTQGPGGMIGADGRSVTPLPGMPAPPARPTPAGPPPMNTADYYDAYLKAIAGHKHRIVKAGDVIHIGGLTDTIVASDAKFVKALPGAGEANASCTGMEAMLPNGGEENTRSVSSLLTYGKVKIAAFGDLTWDREKDLFCPNDRIGKVDIYLASHHGTQWSGSPAMINSLQPIVTIMGNAPNKGDDPDRVKIIQANPRFQALWRLHNSRQHPDIDGTPDMVANIGQGQDGDYNLRLRITRGGQITVINDRNGFNKTYQAGG
jgi:beta-lactamase superfamily II metal-dependent hydrolase